MDRDSEESLRVGVEPVSTVVVSSTCVCGSIGRTDLRQCPTHFHIYNGDVRLTSVGRVLKQFFPLPAIDPAILENARERGSAVDALFADYVRGTLRVIPAGTRSDVVALLYKLIAWYDRQSFKKVEVQVLLGGKKYGGIVDFRFDDMLVDLKATSDILPSHEIQVGGYADIEAEMAGDGYLLTGILHVTKSLKEARLVPLSTIDHADEWSRLRNAYEVLEWRKVLTERTA